MDNLDMLDRADVLDGVLRKERVVRDRMNPFICYDEDDFQRRYRFSKETVRMLVDTIGHRLERTRKRAIIYIPPILQLVIALRFYATGSFLKVIGDTFGVHESSVSGIVKSVSQVIASLKPRYITFPTGNRANRIQREFMDLGQIPGVVGVIDCTHIPIQSPGGDNAEMYRNRKGYFSINVQAICDSDNKFSNIVVRWPGSTHDSRIFNNSHIAAQFESQAVNGVLLGDNGYPLRPYLLTPLLRPSTPAEVRYNQHLSKIRVKVENLFGIWKRRFPCLRQQLRLALATSLVVIVSCAVLHNLALHRGDPLPDDEDELHVPAQPDVPPQPVERNEGGQPLRTLMIRRFE